MVEYVDLPVANLVPDQNNPRLPQSNLGERETLRTLARMQGRNLLGMVEDILSNGINPSDVPIVTPLQDGTNRYVVLEGNRRLTGLRSLENPELLVDSVSEDIFSAVRRMAAEYQRAPITEMLCVVVDNRSEANHWIRLKHGGLVGGAGTLRWGSDERERFRSRIPGETPNLATQVLDFLQKSRLITHEQRAVAPTTLTRIFSSPAIREKVGLDYQKGILMAVGDPAKVANALVYIVNEVSDRRLTVNDVRSKEQRDEFAAMLPLDVVVPKTFLRGFGTPLDAITELEPGTGETDESDGNGQADSQGDQSKGEDNNEQSNGNRDPRPRDQLIPHDCLLRITTPRIQRIAGELRRLRLSGTPNAVGVLFRVFVELSMDEYIQRESLVTSREPTLRNKLLGVTNDLVKKGKISEAQARPARRAAQKGSWLAPSVTLMNDWVHNQYMAPTASDLRTNWDNLQPFIQSIWAP